MHPSSIFCQNDESELLRFIEQYPFATLITQTNNGIVADYLPFTIEKDGAHQSLIGHISKGNSLWKSISDNDNVLVIFNGPDCYISPNLYPSKAETGKAVPTWNYVRAQVSGRISFHHDREWIYQALDDLTRQHESQNKQPWSIDDAPEEYIEKMLKGVVGIKIDITAINGTWKVSQNQPEKNQQALIQAFSNSEDHNEREMAVLIHQHKASGES